MIAIIIRAVFVVQVKRKNPVVHLECTRGSSLEGSEKEEKGFIYTFSPCAIRRVEFIFFNNMIIISAPWVV
mgnify:CR=1 FL=1